jgi:hypothetical protein
METPDSPSSPWGRPSTQASRDWARQGHSPAAPLSLVVRARPTRSADTIAAVPLFSRKLRRATGTVLLAVVALGSAGSALALNDALFPTVGATTRSVWQNPGEPVVARTQSASTTSTTTTTSTTVATVNTTRSTLETIAESEPRSTTPPNDSAPEPATARPRNTTPPTGTFDDEDDSSGSDNSGSGNNSLPSTTDDDDDESAVTTVSTSTPPSDGSSPPTTVDDEDDSSGSDNSGSDSDDG